MQASDYNLMTMYDCGHCCRYLLTFWVHIYLIWVLKIFLRHLLSILKSDIFVITSFLDVAAVRQTADNIPDIFYLLRN